MNPLKTQRGRGVGLGLALALVLGSTFGCKQVAVPDKRSGPASANLSGLESDDVLDESKPCDEGATRHCRVVLGVHGKVTSCFEGVRVCQDGEWGNCGSPPDDEDGDDED